VFKLPETRCDREVSILLTSYVVRFAPPTNDEVSGFQKAPALSDPSELSDTGYTYGRWNVNGPRKRNPDNSSEQRTFC